MLQVSTLLADIKLAAGSPPPGFVPIDAVNNVGRIVAGLHSWKWRERIGRISTRAPITLTGATWTEATKTLTKTAAFTNYALLAGDEVEITGGTNAVLGFYRVASRTSADAIVLESSIGATADTQTNIAGTIDTSASALPSDCEALIDRPRGHKAQNEYIDLVSRDELLARRLNSMVSSTEPYAGCISYGQFAAGGAPVMRLELYPSPSQNVTSAYVAPYKAKWQDVTKDADYLPIPDYLEPFFRDACRLYARAVVENDVVGFAERISARLRSPDYAAVLYIDGMVQPGYGKLGATVETSTWFTFANPA